MGNGGSYKELGGQSYYLCPRVSLEGVSTMLDMNGMGQLPFIARIDPDMLLSALLGEGDLPLPFCKAGTVRFAAFRKASRTGHAFDEMLRHLVCL